MPIPIPTGPEPAIYPSLTIAQIDAARTSAWYPTFEDLTIPTIIINLEELGEKDSFLAWLESESIFIPVETEAPSQEESDTPQYHLPKLSREIRESIAELGGNVFPKLNWTAPRDAAFLLPQTSGPLSCTSAYDIYLLLKSSDFVSHSIDPERAYEGAVSVHDRRGSMGLELVLKRYEAINPSREFRCFVRDDILIGASVRDFNFYPHFQDLSILEKTQDCIRTFYEDEILGDYQGGKDYIFDIVLNDSNSSCRLVDFNPYNLSSDSLLFTYEELHQILLQARVPPPVSSPNGNQAEAGTLGRLPILKVIDSPSHPGANRGMPAFGTNMLPVEIVEMSQGRGVGEFKAAWDEVVRDGLAEESDSESDSEMGESGA